MRTIDPFTNRILVGDARRVLTRLPDASVDLIATDPPYGISFMGKDWDRTVPLVAIWQECLRVLKPGGFAFVMSSPRLDCLSAMTDRLREAGFRIDFTPLYWTYLTGFPKAMHVLRAHERRSAAQRRYKAPGNAHEAALGPSTAPETPLARRRLQGAYGGFQPKPAVEVVIVAMKPIDEEGYLDHALRTGKGVTWLDDARIPFARREKMWRPFTDHRGGRTSYVIRGPRRGADPRGRFPANLLVSDDALGDVSRHFDLDAWFARRPRVLPPEAQRRFPFLIAPKASTKEREEGLTLLPGRQKPAYCLKYDRGEQRNKGARIRNTHPTVKPIKLMSYLITLGSRPGDVVLDPFVGSGTTCVAAKLLGRRWIGIEVDSEYARIARARLRRLAASAEGIGKAA